MAKQIVVYEKDNGTIFQVLLFDQAKVKIEDLGLEYAYDELTYGFLEELPSKFINIKKDRVIDGKVVTLDNTKSVSPNVYESEATYSDSLFEDITYRSIPEHVGLITTWNKQCGIADYSKDLVNNSNSRITIFCERSSERSDDDDPNIKVVPCWGATDNSYRMLVETLKKNKIDIAHVQYNHDLMNAGQLKIFGKELKEAGIRGIITLHSTKGGVDIYGESFDTLIAHSRISAEDLIGEHTHKDQIEIIPIGTKETFPDEEKKLACLKKGINDKRPIIANFGFFLPQKGVKEQLQALVQIKEKFPDVLLLAVCSIHKINDSISNKYYRECERLSIELGLQDNVKFITEYLEFKEIFEYLHCSDIIVLPYVNSASQAASSAGRTILTAMRPVIVSDVDIFSDLETIVPKVRPGDVNHLADEIISLLSDKTKQEEILNNINRFVDKTSWENVARAHDKVYKALGDIKIDIVGQVFSYFSASVVNRNLACALNDIGADITLKSVNLAENKDYELADDSRDLLMKNPSGIVQVNHQYPPEFKEFNARTKIVYLQAETSLPEKWVKDIKNSDIDFIWAYSTYAKEQIKKAGVNIPIEVIPCGYDPKLFNEDVIPINLAHIRDSYTKKAVEIDDDTFVFMFVGAAQERKNFQAMFKAYLTEFKKDENIVFVIKSYSGGEVHKIIDDLTNFVSETLEIDKEELPKFIYIYEDTEPQILPSYFKAANVMVQCSRAEGFGKPIVEAMGMGIPSIVCLFSGPKDFCNDHNSFPVPFKLVRSTYHVQSNDLPSLWAETKIEDLRKVMRFCFENPQEVKRRGNQALVDSEKWTLEESAFKVVKFVRKYNL